MINIGIGLNDPAQRHDLTSFFDELNMKEEILTTYIGEKPPITNVLNESNYPIDRIWCNSGLAILRSGYSKFKEAILSDNLVLWVESPLRECFVINDNIIKKWLNSKRVIQVIWKKISQGQTIIWKKWLFAENERIAIHPNRSVYAWEATRIWKILRIS